MRPFTAVLTAALLASGSAYRCPAGPASARPWRDFPAVGVAVADSSGWCAMFPPAARGIRDGLRVTLVVTDTGDGHDASFPGTVVRRRVAPCTTAFPQPRWEGYLAVDLDVPGPRRPPAWAMPVVADPTPWRRDRAGRPTADLDADGAPEVAERCAAGEGLHYMIWTESRSGRVRRAHEYFDVGEFVDETCTR